MKRIIVVGGGISGLATAYLIKKLAEKEEKNIEIFIIEEKSFPGGKIQTQRIDGFLCEEGPNGFLDSKPAPKELAIELGIGDRLLPSNEGAKKRYIFTNNNLYLVPTNPLVFFFSDILSIKGRLRILKEPWAKKGEEGKDETVAEFGSRRIGDEAVKKLLDPLVSGVWAGDPEKLSLKSCFPRISQLEEEYGSLIKAMIKIEWKRFKERKKGEKVGHSGPAGPGGVLTSFINGTGELISSLYAQLKNNLKLNYKVVSIKKDDKRNFILGLLDRKGEKVFIKGEIVILAIPSYEAANVIESLDVGISEILDTIPYAAATMVCFGYSKKDILRNLDGFGFLVPYCEGRKILGALWSSSIFPNRAPQDDVLIQVIVGGARRKDLALLNEKDMTDMVCIELYETMGIGVRPKFIRIFKHEFAIPQYEVGHLEILKKLDSHLANYKGLILTGNAYRGVSLSDCVKNAYITAEEVVKNLL